MSELTDRITAVLRAHDSGTTTFCSGCGAPADTRELHAAHVAERVAEALQLTEEWAVRYAYHDEMRAWGCGHEVIFTSRENAEDRVRFLHCIDDPREQSAEPVGRWVSGWSAVEDGAK